MGKIRKVKVATQSELDQLTDSNIKLVLEGDYIYGKAKGMDTMNCGYVRMGNELILKDAGRAHIEMYGHTDIFNAVRDALQPHMQGLDACDLSTLYGHFDPELRDGKRVFVLDDIREAAKVIVRMTWPIDRSPVYDMGPESKFFKTFGVSEFTREMPSDDQPYGADLIYLDRSTLGAAFERQTQTDHDVKMGAIEDSWRSFELTRDYYRQEIQPLLQLLCDISDGEIDWDASADYAIMQPKSPSDSASSDDAAKGTRMWFWYDKNHAEIAERIITNCVMNDVMSDILGFGGIFS